MQQITPLLDPQYFNCYSQKSNYIYDFLQKLSNTTIFLQYDAETFLSFKVYEVSQGVVVYLKSGKMAIQCQIRGTTYTLNRNHLIQMSNRECHEFFNQLGIDGNQFFQD